MLELSVCWKVICFGRSSVEVIDDLGSSIGLEPVNGKTNIVYTSPSRLSVFLGCACECVSFTLVGGKSRWEKDVGLTQEAEEVMRVSFIFFPCLMVAVVEVVYL